MRADQSLKAAKEALMQGKKVKFRIICDSVLKYHPKTPEAAEIKQLLDALENEKKEKEAKKEAIELAKKEQEEKRKRDEVHYSNRIYGRPRPEIICPSCQSRGYVYSDYRKRKTGFSTAKTTGAVLTLGMSTLVTGLAKKEWTEKAHCTNCGCDWMI